MKEYPKNPKHLIFLLVFSILLLPVFFSPAWASQVASHDVVVDVDKAGLSHFSVDMTYALLTTDMVYYLIGTKIANLQASDDFGPLACTVEKDVAGTQVACEPNTANRTDYAVHFEFDALDLVGRTNSRQIFDLRQTISEPTASFTFGFRLPEGMVLTEPANESYSPEGAFIGSTGRRVTLDWDLSPELGASYEFIVKYEPPFGFPVPVSFDYLYGVLAVAVGLIIYFWYFKAKKVTRTEAILSVLSGDEKKVLEAIQEKGDTCRQRDIVRATGFSKAKVSRVIAALEKRGIIKKEPVGRTNKIVLKEKKLVKPKPAKPTKKGK